MLFFAVSGGPYGLEPLVTAVNPGWAFVLVAIVPLIWGLPIALMVAELSSLLPDEGGYYVWVDRALGPFWGVQEGWWSMCGIAFDLALYPVLFVDYLAYFVPSLALDANGKFLALRVSGFGNLGAWLSNATTIPPTLNTVKNIIGVYATPLIDVSSKCMFTNTTPVGAYRGAGRPEGHYYMERLVDTAAREMQSHFGAASLKSNPEDYLREDFAALMETMALASGMKLESENKNVPNGLEG